MTPKILFTYSIILILGFSLFIMKGCGGKKQIEGIVNDPLGKGIEGVSVQMLKSTYSAKTDKGGHYSIDYATGTFTIKYSKPGYKTHKLDLTIQNKDRFPAETIVMFPMPESKGIYYIGEKEVIEIKPVKIKISEKIVKPKSGIYSTYYCRFYAPTKGNTKIKSGNARFIDTIPNYVSFAKLGEKNPVLNYSIQAFGDRKYIYNGFTKDKLV